MSLRNLLFFLISWIFVLTTNSCRKTFGCQGTTTGDAPPSPYQGPVWYPDGSLLGFNHKAVQSVTISHDNCMIQYYPIFYPDSSGFWLVNKDGSNMRQATTFQLYYPSWSPDGKWIAFCNSGIIYKMAFNGTNFDTSHVIPLTDNIYKRFYPSWSPHSDTIFYDSNQDSPDHAIFYNIWKMAADGSGQTRITDSTFLITNGERQPVCTPDGHVLYYQYPKGSQQMQLFVMDADGNNKRQITDFSENFGTIDLYTYFNNQIYFEYKGIWRVNMNGSNAEKIYNNSYEGFSISSNGIISYVNFSGGEQALIDKTHGIIWTMDSNGNNTKPLTYNIY